MNILKLTTYAFGALATVGLVGMQAQAAGACSTLASVNGVHRLFPTAAQIQDFVDMDCGGTKATVAVTNSSGSKAVRALLTAGTGSDFARTDGLTSAGALIAGCSATDLPPVNTSQTADTVGCNAAVRWKGQVNF